MNQASSKLVRFAQLIDSLMTTIEGDPFLSFEQKDKLCSFVAMINANVQYGVTKGIERRLCMARNTWLEYRAEGLRKEVVS